MERHEEAGALIATLRQTMRETERLHLQTHRLALEIRELGNWRGHATSAQTKKCLARNDHPFPAPHGIY